MFDFGFGGSGLFRFLFRSFRWFRWFRSGCSGGFVPVVPGFSTCLFSPLVFHEWRSAHRTTSFPGSLIKTLVWSGHVPRQNVAPKGVWGKYQITCFLWDIIKT